MESINISISMSELCRRYVVPNTFYAWKEKFLEAGKMGLSGGLRKNGHASKELEHEKERLKTLIGELTIANDSQKSAGRGEKMTAIRLMLEKEMSLRRTLRYSGMSSCSYYYRPVPRIIQPDPALVGKVEELTVERPF
ncbi:MAG: hypothetical protein JRN34_01230 [Nitrososphaerota archaeon]|jgi:transposase-like protein|nr:hypothetical protein [Nitrososphaerota archaeon]MDG6941532.1 hypothetical protein [Nitrososphaerota archaeon]MDG6951073.1 hypothetical protein [Nitrososphaerota archaeon]